MSGKTCSWRGYGSSPSSFSLQSLLSFFPSLPLPSRFSLISLFFGAVEAAPHEKIQVELEGVATPQSLEIFLYCEYNFHYFHQKFFIYFARFTIYINIWQKKKIVLVLPLVTNAWFSLFNDSLLIQFWLYDQSNIILVYMALDRWSNHLGEVENNWQNWKWIP